MTKLPLFALLAIAATVHAQGAPGTISFVARLADNGVAITGPHDVGLALFDASTGGTAGWTETRSGVIVPSDGLLYLDLGSVTPLDATVFSGTKKYLEITIDGQVTAPRIVIESAPYAIRAGEASHSLDSDSLGTHPASFYQARVSNACASGSAIASIDATGSITCQPVPIYTAGTGLVLTGTQFAVDPTAIQARVSGACNSGAIESIAADGSIACLTAGTGLAFTTGQFQVDFATTQHAIAPCAAGAVLSKTDSAGTATCITVGTGLAVSGSSWTVDTTAVQKRVSGTCSSGAITAIAADGTVTCGGMGAVGATVAASGQTNSTTYVGLGAGPAVTTTIGASGNALVTVTAAITPTNGNSAIMGFSIDGAAATDTQSLETATTFQQASATYLVTGLSAGSHTFTARYRVTAGGNAQFANRSLIVIPQ
jgi:hypothetical protein